MKSSGAATGGGKPALLPAFSFRAKSRLERRLAAKSSGPTLLFYVLLLLLPARAQEIRHLTILHTNDLHAHLTPDDAGMGGFAYLAAAVRQERENCAACIFLNAGDLVQGTPVSTIYRGVPVYEIGNLMGFDASVVGNHEFDYGWEQLLRFGNMARYPLLSANAVNKSGKPITGQAYVIKNVGGVRVAVIGALMGDLANGFSTPQLLGPVRVEPVVETVRRYAHELRPRSDLIVVLGHIQDEELDSILRDVPEVSVVVTGHDHRGFKEMHNVDGRVGVLLRGYGTELGRLELDVDMSAKKLRSAEWKRIPVDSKKIAPAGDVAKQVDHWESQVSKMVDVEIGEAAHAFDHDQVRRLVERAMVELSGADIAFVNSGGIRDTLPAGKILARHIWNILPFDNILVIGTFKGSQLSKEAARGKTLDPNREYKLVTSDFTAANQQARSELNTQGLEFPIKGANMRDAVIEWIRKQKRIE